MSENSRQLKKNAKWDDAYLATALTLPANTNSDGDETAILFDTEQVPAELIVVAKTACDIANAKILTVKLLAHSTAAGVTDTNPSYQAIYTASGAKTWAIGDIICRVPIPVGMAAYKQFNIATDDAAATGTIDAYLHYLAR